MSDLNQTVSSQPETIPRKSRVGRLLLSSGAFSQPAWADPSWKTPYFGKPSTGRSPGQIPGATDGIWFAPSAALKEHDDVTSIQRDHPCRDRIQVLE